MTDRPDLGAFLAAHRAARGGAPLPPSSFPEQFGSFQFWAPDPGRGVTEWQVSDGGGWYPIALADRDACLVFAGAMTAGMTMVQVEQLRDQHNRATPSEAVTARHLLDALDPGWDKHEEDDEESCEDCGWIGSAEAFHACNDDEEQS